MNVQQRHTLIRKAKNHCLKIVASFCAALLCLLLMLMLGSLIKHGHLAFFQTYIKLDISLPRIQYASQNPPSLAYTDAQLQDALKASLLSIFPLTKSPRHIRELTQLVGMNAHDGLLNYLPDAHQLIQPNIAALGTPKTVNFKAWVLARNNIDAWYKHPHEFDNSLSLSKLNWLKTLLKENRLALKWHPEFFTQPDSRDSESAGIGGALTGSLMTIMLTWLLSVPLGIGSALYLEEYAKKNIWKDWLEANINNLASVPPIIFGLLGLVLFINLLSVPRASAFVAGIILSLMVFPTVVVSSRAALISVPGRIKYAAMSLGASKTQVLFHHTFPIALPGMITGSIIATAHALGATAPLLMIGMVAFIPNIANLMSEPTTVLPIQIYLWSDHPQHGFLEKTAGAILVLISTILLLNTTAAILRRYFEQKNR